MKIDRGRIKKSTSEVPPECQALIEKLRSCSRRELLEELKKIDTWTFGKCELFHWIDILDLCDSILEAATARVAPKSWQIACDLPENHESKELLLWVLHFTTLLIEHSFSRHLYNSVEHLLTLLSSCDLNVVLGVLNLLYMFSKRSNFITRINPEMRTALLKCLTYLAESWGGRENGFGLADCVREDTDFPPTATTLHYEFYTDDPNTASIPSSIHLENVDQMESLPSEIMDGLIESFKVPKDGHMQLFTHLRLAHSFSNHSLRLKCVQARLQALSVLLYSNADSHNLLYPGILDELVQLLEINNPGLVEIRSAALRTLTSIIHLDRSPHLPKKPGSRLTMIIDVTGAGLYHGFLPQLVRSCITSLTSETKEGEEDQFPLPLATALFSFLYHLASYEAGGEALVSCGMMECLLRVINWPGVELEHITFVTRAVRVIDLITNIDMQSFQSHGGLNSFINRLQMEMAICRQEQPYEIQVPSQRLNRSDSTQEGGSPSANPTEAAELDDEMVRIANSVDRVAVDSDSGSCSKDQMPEPTLEKVQTPDENAEKSNKTCLPQRAALLKSMLNFLKKALQDPAFTESIRHVMDGSLPSSLKHIISNAEYYGPSLFLLATDVVAVYVFQEPSLLSSLQDVGLTEVVLHALLIKNVPATREVLGSVPNVFSALCLNSRGLQSFVAHKPFEKLFKVLLSPNYLSAMRRRRSSDPIGDTASNLGNAMDELMRHQPTLKSDAIAAIIKLLQELCQLGRDPKYVCWKPQKGSSNESPHPAPRVSNEAGSSDEEEEDEEEASTSSHPQPTPEATPTTAFSEKTPIALVDYILNVMKFVDAILSNNSTDDHCREFVLQNGLVPLLSILGLPNLPVDYPITPAAQAVASVCKSVLNLAHEPQVMRQGLTQLSEVLSRLGPLCTPHHSHCGSLLLDELAKAPCIDTAFSTPSATPLLHAMAATHGYVIMFVHVCRTGQLDIRTISMTHWGSELGLSVLSQLADLYTALVWESTVLLALCSEDSSREFNKEDVYKIYPPSMLMQAESMEVSTEGQEEVMEVDDDKQCKAAPSSAKPVPLIPQTIKLKYIKPLLGASSRLGRALAELFGLLVKLCVGFPVRTRRGNHLTNTPVSPSPWALAVSNSLATLLARGLNHNFLPNSSVIKFKLTYLICSVGFTQPMLFDEKRYPYHLMLLKFVRYKGQAAFFETFKWALSAGGKFSPEVGLNNEELPEGTGEFLDAWLLLLEKLVNPKAILETTHQLGPRVPPFNVNFDPIKYLQQVHKRAFEALSYLWGRKPLPTYGARMTETMLTIYRHIVRGEKIVEALIKAQKEEEENDFMVPSPPRPPKKEKMNSTELKVFNDMERKQKESSGETTVLVNPAAGEGRRGGGGRERPEVNSTELSQLMDMGFSREHCYEALILTSSLEHATDYLLNNFFPHNVQPTQTSESEEPEELEEPLTKEALDEFSNQVLQVCLDYVEKLPETVYRVCDLLTIIIRRNGETFCYRLLNTLAEETIQNVHLLLEELCNMAAQRRMDIFDQGSSNIDVHEIVLNSPYSIRIAGNLHLFMLLFEEMKVPCAKVVHASNLLNVLVRLLVEVTEVMEEGAATPKWMAPLLLLIDLLEKVSVCVTRKVNMHKVTTQVWRWLDLASGRWSLYLPHNNKLINEAYWRGDRDVTITSGRRRYTIAFPSMCQINDDSGKARPVMMTLIDPKDPTAKSNYDNQPTDLPPYPSTVNSTEDKDPNDTVESLSEPEYYVDFFHRRVGLQPITGVNPQDIQTVLRCCMQLISKPVDPDTLHAVMQVCVRFTRDYDNARLIAEMGAVKRLLKLRQVSSFNGFVGLSTMLIRHILEEPANITAAIERVIRFKTLPNIPPTFKELHYILRECAPAICRDPEIFKTVAKEIMRVDVSVLNKRSEEDDPRLLMKCLPSDNQKNNKEVDRLVKKTVTQLLNFLVEARQEEVGINDVIPEEDQSCDGTLPPPGTQPAEPLHFDENISTCSTVRLDRDEFDVDTFNASNLPMYIAASGPISSSGLNKKQSTSNGQQKNEKLENLFERKKKLPLLLISYILKILGDAVRSYTCIAKMITDHKFSAKQAEILKEDCSAVAFVLDHLMPYRELNVTVDPERPNMARNLIAALASCNHSPEAQCALVSEVKAALQRALAWPESAKKHTHIQDLVGVVTTMIDNCPPVPISSTPLSPALKLNQYSVNNMVRFMMRKGIVTDLARIPHSLDLSSPKMAATINAALKPLETLSRIMGQPAAQTPSKAKPKGSTSTTTVDETGSTLVASAQSEVNQPTQMDQSGTAAGAEEDNPDMIDDNPILNEVMNSVVERVNEMEDLMQNVIERRRIPLNNSRRNRRSRGRTPRVISELSRFSSIFSSSNDLNNFSNNEETSQDSSSDDSDSNPTDEERHMEDAATDIDDHVEDEDDDDDEEEEDDDEDDDDDDDDDDDQEGEENEGEESNGGYDEDGLELFEPDEGLFRIPGLDRDSDDFLMIEYSEPDPSAPLGQPWSRDNFLPFTLFEEGNNSSDNSGTRSSIPTQHPLLMARNVDSQHNTTSSNRTQRMSRTRRYQYVQMNRAAVAAPVFLQRLMGQSNSDPPNYLNIPGHPGNTYGEMLASTFPNTRLIVMDNGLGILTNSEEEQINFVDQSGYLLGPSLAATLNNVPTSMYWWNEELRLLDRDSICDCSICVGFELVPIFEQYRNEEFSERKEKRKKMDDEEDNNKKANTSNGETEKKKLYDGIMDMFDSPRPPARMPTRRIAMLAAAQEVAHATESLAGSIVESVLHPRVVQPPGARPLLPIQPPAGPSSPQEPADPPPSVEEQEQGDVLVVPFAPPRRAQASTIPEALELIPVAPPVSEISDPMGLIPGSVPYPPPSDPEDGFFRVNPPPSITRNENSGERCESSEEVRVQNSTSESSEPQTETMQSNEQRALTSLPVDMSPSSNSSHSLFVDSPPAGIAGLSQSSQNSTQSLFVDSPAGLTTMSQPSQRNEALEIEMAANWLQSVTGGQGSPIEEERFVNQAFSQQSQTSQELQLQTQAQTPVQDVESPEYPPPPPPPMPAPSEPIPEPSAQPSMSSQSSLMPEEIPEGVDPSFLAALPEDMRAEVISEHLRLQRLQSRVQQSSSASAGAAAADDTFAAQGPSGMEVNADFLAALPPAIQEEVLAQQRLEQQRQAAALSNPNDPVDAAAFFQDLPHSLRQAILTDMEESQISVLPPELAAEAQNLRREWEARNRQLMQERFLSHVTHSTSALSSILRHTTTPRNLRRPTGPRYTIQNMGPGSRTPWLSSWNLGARLLDSTQSSSQTGSLSSANLASAGGIIGRPRGRQVLDYESICCLLVLLFVDDSRLNTARLHRVFRNLCYHPPTREWVIRAILSIMEKSNEGQAEVQSSASVGATRRMTRSQSQPSPEPPATPAPAPAATTTATTTTATTSPATTTTSSSGSKSSSSWLNISMDAALGCRATVFHVHKNPGRRNDRTITINPQAAPFVYRHALEILISLARIFPSYFVPGKHPMSSGGSAGSSSVTASPPKASKSPRPDNSPNFWDLLIRLDSLSTSKKGKAVTRQSVPSTSDSDSLCLESSPFGQLLKMLASPVVHRSPLLMDKLLRLLSLISISLQVHRQRLWDRLGLQVEVNPTTLHHLGLAIDVLTSNTCSEEGLEDATALLLNMTVSLPNTRETVLNLLLGGARQMASMVCVHIETLLQELRVLNSQQAHNDDLDDNAVDSRITSLKGILSNRFTKDTVVVTAPKKVKAGLDLQLNSMAPLISKTSSQAFFLRILKVIVQLRESVRNFDKKKRKQAAEAQEEVSLRPNVGSSESAMDTTQATVDIVVPPTPPSDNAMDTNQSSQGSTSSSSDVIPPTPPGPGESMESSLSRFLRQRNATTAASAGASNASAASVAAPTPTSDNVSDRPSTAKSQEEESPLPPLSEQLNLDILWNTLSECLTELQHTNDNHAVLVLQPAVEAFFLVHASGMEKADQKGESRNSSEQPIVMEETAAPTASATPAAATTAATQQSLGLDGLTQAPPPVSPLPTDPANDPSTSQASTSNYFLSLSQESNPPVPPHQLKFLKFAETHRTVLNQILRQCTTPLLEGPFAVLVNHTRVLDFDVKRRYFRGELERADEGHRREELAVHVRRTQVFEDSFRELHRRSPDEWKNRFYIVFEGEEGQDAGGLLREWYMIISREIFNPMYALFTTSPGDRVTYMINPSSHCNPNHLCYFKFVGRVIAKAIYDNKLLECYFTRSFYKHILGILVKYTDMESEDYSFYKGLVFLMENHVDMLGYDLTFSTEVQEFGVTDVRDLLPNGRNILVTEDNKMEYIRLVCQMKMTGAIRKQLNAFLEGFYDIIPKRLISIFNEQELELLISGLPNVDIEDLKANTEYYKYQPNSLQIQWFWRALREFDQAERAKFLQFVTGTSKVPLQGFAALEGMNGVQKFQIHRDERSTDRLPSAHTCFNQLDLPVYETYTKLRTYLLKAIHECSEGFGFA